jgi:hypothetical protein
MGKKGGSKSIEGVNPDIAVLEEIKSNRWENYYGCSLSETISARVNARICLSVFES